MIRPGNLALKALNQYRKRDLFAYLPLRYYLNCSASRSDRWIEEVAVQLVIKRSAGAYFPSEHFKEINADGTILHRRVFVPCANEALVEAALLSRCSKERIYQNPMCVFSYHLASTTSRFGLYDTYFQGLQKRQTAIAEACDAESDQTVLMLDIKKFYPSIRLDLAESAWGRFGEASRIESKWIELGKKLLADYRSYSIKSTLLTGPMFSHLIANLLLRDLDEFASSQKDVQYFRYVDDITLVGGRAAVSKCAKTLKDRLSELGLELHEEHAPKTIRVSSNRWLEGRNDFQSERGAGSWLELIRGIKNLLVRDKDGYQKLLDLFAQEGVRIPVLDYSAAMKEQDTNRWYSQLVGKKWFRKRVDTESIGTVHGKLLFLRARYSAQLDSILTDLQSLTGYERKRVIPKARLAFSRLLFLGPNDRIAEYLEKSIGIPELTVLGEIARAITSGNVNRIFSLGTNVAHTAAQLMKQYNSSVEASLGETGVARDQSFAIFAMYGIPVRNSSVRQNSDRPSEIVELSTNGASLQLMKSKDPFIREFACLHGVSSPSRHKTTLESAFDEDEALFVDTTAQFGEYDDY